MDSSSIASRLKLTPRFRAIRSPQQLQVRLQSMTPVEIWNAMAQPGLAGWKHRIMSIELEARKKNALLTSGLLPFIKEF